MNAIASAELIAELDGAIRGGSPGRRAHMLRQLTQLFLANANRFDERQIGVFGDVFIRLIDLTEPNELGRLSTVLSDSTSAPREVVGLLARHAEPTVAAPILLKSEALSEGDLVEIANHCSQQHLLAIAGRQSLDEAVTDALLKRDDITVCRALASNGGARFSDQGCLKLAAAAEYDGEVADALAVRPSMPVKMLHEHLTAATKAAQAGLLKTAPLQPCRKSREVTESSSAGARAEARQPIDYAASKARVLALSHAGKLGDSTVNRFAVHGQRTDLVAALSLLADAAIEIIELLLEQDDCYGLIVACRASRLNWQTTLAVIDSRSGARKLTAKEIGQGQELFEALSLSVAQRTIRFGSVSELAKPRLTDNACTAARAI